MLGLGGASEDPAQQAARDELIVRFGQTTGPVLAKGVEDTAFYRWSRLAALNEVGGDPDVFGVSPAEFHAEASRLAARWPATMTTLSTHDTKRQEDVRARLAVLAEWPQEWAHQVAEWHGMARWLTDGAAAQATERAPEPDLEYLMWQTLAGAWLIGGERAASYLGKAMHEAKTRTSWTVPRSGIRVGGARTGRRRDQRPGADGRHRQLRGPDRARCPGELPRRQAGAAHHARSGGHLPGLRAHRACRWWIRTTAGPSTTSGAGGCWPRWRPARTRRWAWTRRNCSLTSRALRLRRDHPDWFAGDYVPLACEGPAAEHAVAFLRGGHAVTVATRLPAGLRRRGGWADTVLPLPELHWRDVLTGVRHAGLRPPLAELTWRLPVALLVPERVYVPERDRAASGDPR